MQKMNEDMDTNCLDYLKELSKKNKLMGTEEDRIPSPSKQTNYRGSTPLKRRVTFEYGDSKLNSKIFNLKGICLWSFF